LIFNVNANFRPLRTDTSFFEYQLLADSKSPIDDIDIKILPNGTDGTHIQDLNTRLAFMDVNNLVTMEYQKLLPYLENKVLNKQLINVSALGGMVQLSITVGTVKYVKVDYSKGHNLLTPLKTEAGKSGMTLN